MVLRSVANHPTIIYWMLLKAMHGPQLQLKPLFNKNNTNIIENVRSTNTYMLWIWCRNLSIYTYCSNLKSWPSAVLCVVGYFKNAKSTTSLNNEHIRGRRLVCDPITIQNLITDCTHIWRDSHLRGEMLGISSVRSPTSFDNGHIRGHTH